jgi:DNA-directed RNA polymerase subunit H (RpoH/RPB5)
MMAYRGANVVNKILNNDELTKHITTNEYVTIEATRPPSDIRGAGHILICYTAGKYSSKSGDFEKLAKILISKTKVDKNLRLEMIFVCDIEASSHITKKIQSLKLEFPTVDIDFLHQVIFMLEIPKHVLVPKHEILSENETDKLLESLYSFKSRFPKISSTDPMAIWIGCKPGMLVKITRYSDISGTEIAYRHCI